MGTPTAQGWQDCSFWHCRDKLLTTTVIGAPLSRGRFSRGRIAGRGRAADRAAVHAPLIRERSVSVAAAKNVAVSAAVTLSLAGRVVIEGATRAGLTMRVAALLVALPGVADYDGGLCWAVR